MLKTDQLDDFKAIINWEKDAIEAVVSSSPKNPIDIEGTFTLKPSGEFTFNGKLAFRQNGTGIEQLLTMRNLKKGTDGKFIIKERGRIPITL